MPTWSLIAKGALEDAAGLAEDLGHLFRKHGADAVALSTDQFVGDPRDIEAMKADPNAPIEATPAVAEPDDAAPATDETRDDLKDPGPTADEERAEQDRKAELAATDVPAPRPPGPLS